MDERDDWLEGVRRWYFGGEAPADAPDDELSWPRSDSAGCTDCARRSAAALQQNHPVAAQNV